MPEQEEAASEAGSQGRALDFILNVMGSHWRVPAGGWLGRGDIFGLSSCHMERLSGTRVKQGTQLETTVDVPVSNDDEQGGGSDTGMGGKGWQKAQGSAFGFVVPFTQSTPGLWVTGLSLAPLVEPTACW